MVSPPKTSIRIATSRSLWCTVDASHSVSRIKTSAYRQFSTK
jgi:hypothetical protein